jgi:glycerophosphoryl diester phosphodiesterase
MPDHRCFARFGAGNQALLIAVALISAVVTACVGGARDTSIDLTTTARTPGERAVVVSHRGGGISAPENTLPAVTAALAAGFDYVEVDIALTADRQPVLMHDPEVDRTTDGHGALADLTLAEVRKLDAGSWFDPHFAGTRVPTLDEFLDVLEVSGQRALVELKGPWDEASVSSFAAAVMARGLDRRVAVSSFDAATLMFAKDAAASIQRFAIMKAFPGHVVRVAKEVGARGIIVGRRAVIKHPEIVDQLQAAGVRVVVYTLNTDAQWHAVTALGVDGIVTDDPGTLSEWQEGARARG